MATFSVPMYAYPNGDTYVVVEGFERPCELYLIEQNHGSLKRSYFESKGSDKAIGTLEIPIDDNGKIETAYPAKKVFFKDVKKMYLVTEVVEYFEPNVSSKHTVVSSPDRSEDKDPYELFVSISDPLTAATTMSYEYVIAHNSVDTINLNETFVVCEGMRKRYTGYQEVAWFVAPSHRIISVKKLS